MSLAKPVLQTLDGITIYRYPDGRQVAGDINHPLTPCYVSTAERDSMHPARFAVEVRTAREKDGFRLFPLKEI